MELSTQWLPIKGVLQTLIPFLFYSRVFVWTIRLDLQHAMLTLKINSRGRETGAGNIVYK